METSAASSSSDVLIKSSIPCEHFGMSWEFSYEELKDLVEGNRASLHSPVTINDMVSQVTVAFSCRNNYIGAYVGLNPRVAKLLRATITAHSTPPRSVNILWVSMANGGWGQPRFLKSEWVLNKNIYQNGHLKFSCTIDIQKQPKHERSEPDFELTREIGLSTEFANLLNNQEFADIQFKVEDKYFQSHRVVLMARSEYFAALLGGGFKESLHSAFEVDDVTADVFQALLEYIYTNRVDNLEDLDVEKVLAGADKYRLDGLVALCEQTLSNIVEKSVASPNEVLGYVQLANLHSRNDLKRNLMEHIHTNHKKIRDDQSWNELKEDNPDLAMDVLDSIIQNKKKNNVPQN